MRIRSDSPSIQGCHLQWGQPPAVGPAARYPLARAFVGRPLPPAVGSATSSGASHLRWGQRLAIRSHGLLWAGPCHLRWGQPPAVGPATCGGVSGSLSARTGFCGQAPATCGGVSWLRRGMAEMVKGSCEAGGVFFCPEKKDPGAGCCHPAPGDSGGTVKQTSS